MSEGLLIALIGVLIGLSGTVVGVRLGSFLQRKKYKLEIEKLQKESSPILKPFVDPTFNLKLRVLAHSYEDRLHWLAKHFSEDDLKMLVEKVELIKKLKDLKIRREKDEITEEDYENELKRLIDTGFIN
jgi:hypothetical protein